MIDLIVPRLAGDRHDAQAADLIVDLGIVDDFAEQKNTTIGISPARRISEIDGAFDAITKPKFLRQLYGQVAGRKNVSVGADPFDQVAAVMREDLGLHSSHNIGPAQIDLLRSGRGNG